MNTFVTVREGQLEGCLSEDCKSIIFKGTEYQKQVLECINIARTKIRDIFLQYGFKIRKTVENQRFQVVERTRLELVTS